MRGIFNVEERWAVPDHKRAEPRVCLTVYVFLNPHLTVQMMQNMFQEGLYHVFFKDTLSTSSLTQAANHAELINARIHRWFGTVVNTRLLVCGVRWYSLCACPNTYFVLYELLLRLCVSPQVVQILSALACILSAVTYACVSYNCSVSMSIPIWPSLSVSPRSASSDTQCKWERAKQSEWNGLWFIVWFQYVAAGCLALEVQRKANKLKVNHLTVFFSFSA